MNQLESAYRFSPMTSMGDYYAAGSDYMRKIVPNYPPQHHSIKAQMFTQKTAIVDWFTNELTPKMRMRVCCIEKEEWLVTLILKLYWLTENKDKNRFMLKKQQDKDNCLKKLMRLNPGDNIDPLFIAFIDSNHCQSYNSPFDGRSQVPPEKQNFLMNNARICTVSTFADSITLDEKLFSNPKFFMDLLDEVSNKHAFLYDIYLGEEIPSENSKGSYFPGWFKIASTFCLEKLLAAGFERAIMKNFIEKKNVCELESISYPWEQSQDIIKSWVRQDSKVKRKFKEFISLSLTKLEAWYREDKSIKPSNCSKAIARMVRQYSEVKEYDNFTDSKDTILQSIENFLDSNDPSDTILRIIFPKLIHFSKFENFLFFLTGESWMEQLCEWKRLEILEEFENESEQLKKKKKKKKKKTKKRAEDIVKPVLIPEIAPKLISKQEHQNSKLAEAETNDEREDLNPTHRIETEAETETETEKTITQNESICPHTLSKSNEEGNNMSNEMKNLTKKERVKLLKKEKKKERKKKEKQRQQQNDMKKMDEISAKSVAGDSGDSYRINSLNNVADRITNLSKPYDNTAFKKQLTFYDEKIKERRHRLGSDKIEYKDCTDLCRRLSLNNNLRSNQQELLSKNVIVEELKRNYRKLLTSKLFEKINQLEDQNSEEIIPRKDNNEISPISSEEAVGEKSSVILEYPDTSKATSEQTTPPNEISMNSGGSRTPHEELTLKKFNSEFRPKFDDCDDNYRRKKGTRTRYKLKKVQKGEQRPKKRKEQIVYQKKESTAIKEDEKQKDLSESAKKERTKLKVRKNQLFYIKEDEQVSKDKSILNNKQSFNLYSFLENTSNTPDQNSPLLSNAIDFPPPELTEAEKKKLLLFDKMAESYVERLREEAIKTEPGREVTMNRLKKVMGITFPSSQPELRPYGSWKTGLLIPDSDIDFQISHNGIRDNQDAIKILEPLADNLENFRWVSSIKRIFAASVPLLKIEVDINEPFDHQGLLDGDEAIKGLDILVGKGEEKTVKVDITVETMDISGMATTNYVCDLIEDCPSLFSLVLILKYYLNHKNLMDPYKGGLSSYAISLLVSAWLKRYPTVLQKGLYSQLKSLLEFYATEFQPKQTAICFALKLQDWPFIERTAIVSSFYCMLWMQNPPLLIVDPVSALPKNVTHNAFSFHFAQQELAGLLFCFSNLEELYNQGMLYEENGREYFAKAMNL